ncbi:ABC transporter substrate-binding protein [Paenibacillus sp. 1P07SE]|uniref:ABC transporter substrate-binding protein n=1 Tax=Paenibacillus sp. 1P07SE TaxID=3132209 RepID=UPI0039A52B66
MKEPGFTRLKSNHAFLSAAGIWRMNVLLMLLGMSVLLSACSESAAEKPAPVPLKIVYSSEEMFDSLLRDYFDAAFPGLPVEVIWSDEIYSSGVDSRLRLRQLIDEEKPDLVLFTDYGLYRQLSDDGVLVDLGTRMRSSKDVQEESFHPGVVELLKDNETGGMFGLSPSFDAYSLYYNADLFEQFGIPLPQDGMTWPDILLLAERFKTEDTDPDRVRGYHQMWLSTPYDLMMTIAATEGLQEYDLRRGQITMSTPSWEVLFGSLVDVYRKGGFAGKARVGEVRDGVTFFGPDETAQADLFAQGKAAMTVAPYGMMNAPNRKNIAFNWGIVAPPVSSNDHMRSSGMQTYPIFSMIAGSQQHDQAWEVIQYFNGSRMAKIHAAVAGEQYGMGALSSRVEFVELSGDPAVEGIFRQLPAQQVAVAPVSLDTSFFESFPALVNREIEEAVQDNKSAAEALATIQQEGQLLLDAALKSVE